MTTITERLVKSLKKPAREMFIWDDGLPGFGVRVKPSGRVSYIVQYRTRGGVSRRLTIGPASAYKAEQARDRARRVMVQAKDGGDPASARSEARSAPTVRQLAERFLRDHARLHSKPSYLAQQQRMVDTKIVPALGTAKVAEVKRADVVRVHNALRATPYEANRVLAMLSVLFNYAEVLGLRSEGRNPCRLVKRYPEKRRERLLTDAEVKAIFRALDSADEAGIELRSATLAIRLLFATACRASEIIGLKWTFLATDTDEIVWPDNKAGGEMRKPLTREALDLLKTSERIVGNPHVCIGRDRAGPLTISLLEKVWGRILKKAEVAHCGLHAIRHRAATEIANDPVIPMHVGMKLTGHKTAATYLRYHHAQREQTRNAAEAVSARRRTMLDAQAAGVATIGRKSA